MVNLSIWIVPLMLILGGLTYLISHINEKEESNQRLKPNWTILGIIVGIAVLNELLILWFKAPLLSILVSFYRYGYSVIGGGQIVIPLMIQDLIDSQSFISLHDFLSGYAIDQAVPGPLFSFAAFVGSRSFIGNNFSFLIGVLSGLSIFLPGILLVYFIFPLWKKTRNLKRMQYFLKGVTITAASLILMTAITSIIKLPIDLVVYSVVVVATILLLIKKIPAPLIVLLAMLLGFLI